VTRRLLLGYLAITLMVLGVLAIPLGISFQNRQTQKVTRDLVADAFVQAGRVQLAVKTGVLPPEVDEGIRNYALKNNVRVVVINRLGTLLLDTDPLRETDPADAAFEQRPEFQTVLKDGKVAADKRFSKTLGGGLVYVAVPVSDEGKVIGGLRLTLPTARIDADVRRYWLFLAGMSAVSLLAVTVLGIFLARSLSKPIDALESAAVAFGAGDLGRRINATTGPHELRALGKAFNRTAERLQELINSQEAFVADASHQLRTPLTGLRLRLENLEPDVADGARDDLDAAITEVDRLARMVDGLLTLARIERRDVAEGVPIEVRPFLDERVATWLPFAEERQVGLSVYAPVGIWAVADADRMTQVFDNLIANALDVVPTGGAIRLSAVARSANGDGEAGVELHVVDNGPGMTDHERARAFDRFWRANPRRSTDFGGSGLGLAIVAKLVHADGGSVRLDAALTGGLDAVVMLPAPALLPPPQGERRRRALYR